MFPIEVKQISFYINMVYKIRATFQKWISFGTSFKKSAFLCLQHESDFSLAEAEMDLGLCQTSVHDHTPFNKKNSLYY